MNSAENLIRKKKNSRQTEGFFVEHSQDELRTRYRPPCKIYSVFFAVVPWLNVFLLMSAFVLFLQSSAVVPGMIVDLPVERVQSGIRSSIILVAKALPRAAERKSNTYTIQSGDDGAFEIPMDVVVFFQNERFNLSQPHHIASFRNNLSAEITRSGESSALLYLDEKLANKDAIRLVT
ncbi:MAG: hypothetical protein GX804_03545, partial [Lentisphaerae bacterium]|nr:hypothetical protein [Lentisphaerota bacterium]